ncbi:hypothetical protein M5K25_013906 [Dendrobium thyrsiflorum]|uniref:Uncharacterized protein n=1 Tax=Dendrobium thyrsiflorum TaxID=117978 RepID=A0ABD0UU17_DENTH
MAGCAVTTGRVEVHACNGCGKQSEDKAISTCTPEGLAIVLCSPRALLSFPSFMINNFLLPLPSASPAPLIVSLTRPPPSPAVSPTSTSLSRPPKPHRPKPQRHLPLHPHYIGKLCMRDPDVDHGFLYDDQGRVDILGSPFFDVEFGNDRTADEYVDRIIYQLSLVIEDRIPSSRWYIVGTPPTSPNPVTSPAATTLRATINNFLLPLPSASPAPLIVSLTRSPPPPAVSPTSTSLSRPPKPHRPKPQRHLPLHPHYLSKLCMRDPDVDHGFLYDDQGRVNILGSPFFDVEFGNDRTADEYVDRIIYQLSLDIEDQIPSGRWYIVSAPPTSPNSSFTLFSRKPKAVGNRHSVPNAIARGRKVQIATGSVVSLGILSGDFVPHVCSVWLVASARLWFLLFFLPQGFRWQGLASSSARLSLARLGFFFRKEDRGFRLPTLASGFVRKCPQLFPDIPSGIPIFGLQHLLIQNLLTKSHK